MDWERYTGVSQSTKPIDSIEVPTLDDLRTKNQTSLTIDPSYFDKIVIPGYKVVPDKEPPSFEEVWNILRNRYGGLESIQRPRAVEAFCRLCYEVLKAS